MPSSLSPAAAAAGSQSGNQCKNDLLLAVFMRAMHFPRTISCQHCGPFRGTFPGRSAGELVCQPDAKYTVVIRALRENRETPESFAGFGASLRYCVGEWRWAGVMGCSEAGGCHTASLWPGAAAAGSVAATPATTTACYQVIWN